MLKELSKYDFGEITPQELSKIDNLIDHLELDGLDYENMTYLLAYALLKKMP